MVFLSSRRATFITGSCLVVDGGQMPEVFLMETRDLFNLAGRVAVITGGTGLLGQSMQEMISAAGGIPVLADVKASFQEEEDAEEIRR